MVQPEIRARKNQTNMKPPQTTKCKAWQELLAIRILTGSKKERKIKSNWVTNEAVKSHWHVLLPGEQFNEFRTFSHEHSS